MSDALKERSAAIDTALDRFFIPITLAPALVLLFGIVVYPAIYLLVVSVLNLEPMTMMDPRFVGLKNYVDALTNDQFWDAMRVSGIYVFSTAFLSFTIGLILALTLNEVGRFRTIFVTALLLPWIIPPAISGLMWKWIFHDSWVRGRTTGSILDLPAWVAELSVPAGFGLLFVQALIETVRAARGDWAASEGHE